MTRVVMLLENNVYPQDVRVRSEAESRVKAGHQVTVVAPRGAGQPRRDRVGGVVVRRFTLPHTPASALGFMLEYAVANAQLYLAGAWQLVRGAEVIHLHKPPDTLFGVGLLARSLGRHVVFHHHDLTPELFEAKFGRSPVSALLRLLRAAHLSLRNAGARPERLALRGGHDARRGPGRARHGGAQRATAGRARSGD